MNTTGSSRAPAGTAASRCPDPRAPSSSRIHLPSSAAAAAARGLAPGRAGRARRPRRDGPRGGGRVRRSRRRRGASPHPRSPEPAPRTPAPQRGGGGGCERRARRRRPGGADDKREEEEAAVEPPPASRAAGVPLQAAGPARPAAPSGVRSGTASGACRAPGPRPRRGAPYGHPSVEKVPTLALPSPPFARVPGLTNRPRAGPEDWAAARARRLRGGGGRRGEPPARTRSPRWPSARSRRDATPGGATAEVLRRPSKVPASRFSERVASACGSW